jgi:hypothetical protein
MAGALLASTLAVPAGEKTVIGDFEDPQLTWAIPDWALTQADHVAKDVKLSTEVASSGKQSLKINAAFPGQNWTAAVVELEDYIDLTAYDKIAVDVYLPKDAPEGLKGNIVLTVGDGWTWTEQLRPVLLKPGQWTTVEASIADGSKDWKKTKVDANWRSDIRKVDIRIISDKKPSYTGDVFIDNVRAEVGQSTATAQPAGTAVK